MKNKNYVFYLSLFFICLNFYTGIKATFGYIRQKIFINGVINPKTKTISGSELIKYAEYLNGNHSDYKNPNGAKKYKIKKYGGRFQNFRGLYIKLGHKLFLMLYPNSLYNKPKNIKDFDFHQLYPYDFNRGFISIKKLTEEKISNKFRKFYIFKIDFKTKIPQAFGNFGHFKKEIVLNAPFYPYISAGRNFNPQPDIKFKLNLDIKGGFEAYFNGKIYQKLFSIAKTTNFISLVLAKRFKIKKFIQNGVSVKFFQPEQKTFEEKNKKIYKSLGLLHKYHIIKLNRLNIVYVSLRRSLWLTPPLYSNTLLISKRFADIFPNFYIYQKLNIIRGLIYLNEINFKKPVFEATKNDNLYYSKKLSKISISKFKRFLNAYIKNNPDIKNLVKKFNFIQGVNTVINYPIFPLSYIYFTGFPRTHRLKNGIYYYNNDLNLISYNKIKTKILNRKKKDYYTFFLSGASANISPNSGRTEGVLNFTLTKRYNYRNSFLLNIYKNYYNRGIGLGFSRQIGRFFPIAQTYKQSVFGLANIFEISSETSGNSLVFQNTKRLAELSLGYSFNSIDYNINPQYGSSFTFSYNIANSNILSPFSFSQFVLNYVKNFKIDADNVIAVKGFGVFADGNVPAALDYYLGGINGIMGIPASSPFINNDLVLAEADYRRNLYRGLNLNLLDNLLCVRAVAGDIVGGAGKLGDTVPNIFRKGNLYSFTGLGLHFKTYFFGIYPEMISIYAAKAFGNGITSEYGIRYYIGINQLF